MTTHRAVPVPLDAHEPDRLPIWRCLGCGATTEHEGDLDREPCPALDLFGDAA